MQYMGNKQMALQQSIQHLLVQTQDGNISVLLLGFQQCWWGGVGGYVWCMKNRQKLLLFISDYFAKFSGCCFCSSFHCIPGKVKYFKIHNAVLNINRDPVVVKETYANELQGVPPKLKNKGDISAMLCYTSEKSCYFCGYFFEHEFCSIVWVKWSCSLNTVGTYRNKYWQFNTVFMKHAATKELSLFSTLHLYRYMRCWCTLPRITSTSSQGSCGWFPEERVAEWRRAELFVEKPWKTVISRKSITSYKRPMFFSW